MKIHNVKYLSSYSDRMLSIRQKSINDSIKKLSSGSRYLKSQDDAAMLSVKLKMDAAKYKNESARNKLANAVSFTDLQDGMLSNAQNILSRMSELKGLSINDPLKSQQDIEAYNNEFHNLQKELFDLRLKRSTNQTTNPHLFKHAKRRLAQLKFKKSVLLKAKS